MALAVQRLEPLCAPDSIDGVHVREIIHVGPSHDLRCCGKLVSDAVGNVGPVRDVDRTIVAMKALVMFPMICLVLPRVWLKTLLITYECTGQYLLQVGKNLIGRPSRRVPRIPIRSLGTTVRHHVGRGAASKDSTSGDQKLAIANLRGLLSEVEEVGLGVRGKMGQETGRVLDDGHLIVGTTLNHQDGQLGVSISQPGCHDTASGAA